MFSQEKVKLTGLEGSPSPAYGAALEMRLTRKSLVGSNPTPSALQISRAYLGQLAKLLGLEAVKDEAPGERYRFKAGFPVAATFTNRARWVSGG